MDWQLTIIFPVVFAIVFHGVGKWFDWVAYQYREAKMDKFLRELRTLDQRIEKAKLMRVK